MQTENKIIDPMFRNKANRFALPTKSDAPVVTPGDYVLRLPEDNVVTVMYFVRTGNTIKRRVINTPYEDSTAAYRAAMQMGLIYTNDREVFFNQS